MPETGVSAGVNLRIVALFITIAGANQAGGTVKKVVVRS